MTLDITVTDLFCGAGGSSLGAEAMGARLVMAANHWRLAIETHNANFPNADHDCADISQVNPRRYPRTDVLIASPECTNHSQAKTKKVRATIWDPQADASEERSRATMWDVPRFAEHHRYELVIVENVVEARRWEPFGAWLAAMHSLGYEHRAVYLNSMVAHPTPQSRDRMYVVFWRKGNPAPDLEFRPRCWCWSCEAVVGGIQTWKRPDRASGKYRSQYTYRCPGCAGITAPLAWPAASAIDWSLPTPRIGDRERPLAPATVERIRAGLLRYGPAAIVQAAGHTYEREGYFRTWSPDQPIPTQTGTAQHALVLERGYGGHTNYGRRSRPVDLPLPTQTGNNTQALVVPLRTHGTALAADDEPMRTVVAGNQGQALVLPMREGRAAHPAEAAPISTVVASASEHALVTLRGTRPSSLEATMRPVTEPVGTISAGGVHHALLVRQFGGGAEMSKPVTQPTGTITGIDHHALIQPFTVDYHGQGRASDVRDPLPTQDTRDRHGLVQPAIAVEDCGFRMLEPHEIGRAMAFPDTYEVRGNKRERVRQYGNAVTPPVMTMLLERGIASLAGGREVA